MILIFGGAYQGKTDYAHKRFGRDKQIINGMEREILAWVQTGEDVQEKTRDFLSNNVDAVVICNDISCGIVPTCPLLRKWREEVGRFTALLAEQADEVIRLYCGIATRLK